MGIEDMPLSVREAQAAEAMAEGFDAKPIVRVLGADALEGALQQIRAEGVLLDLPEAARIENRPGDLY